MDGPQAPSANHSSYILHVDSLFLPLCILTGLITILLDIEVARRFLEIRPSSCIWDVEVSRAISLILASLYAQGAATSSLCFASDRLAVLMPATIGIASLLFRHYHLSPPRYNDVPPPQKELFIPHAAFYIRPAIAREVRMLCCDWQDSRPTGQQLLHCGNCSHTHSRNLTARTPTSFSYRMPARASPSAFRSALRNRS